MATRCTLSATGREIVDALRAGKAVMMHVALDGYEWYYAPTRVAFSENEDTFSMFVELGGQSLLFLGSLDAPLVADEGGGGSEPVYD